MDWHITAVPEEKPITPYTPIITLKIYTEVCISLIFFVRSYKHIKTNVMCFIKTKNNWLNVLI